MLVWAVMLGLTGMLVETAKPDPPSSGITTVGSLKLANAEDCAGVVAFSGVSGSSEDARLVFRNILVNKGVGYSSGTGVFTTHCPGLYQFSFGGSGNANVQLTLKRKANNSDGWRPVVSTAAGGFNLVFQDSEVGDQFAVFVDAGKFQDEVTSTMASFSGFRIAKK